MVRKTSYDEICLPVINVKVIYLAQAAFRKAEEPAFMIIKCISLLLGSYATDSALLEKGIKCRTSNIFQ